jgi:hypothetical protein
VKLAAEASIAAAFRRSRAVAAYRRSLRACLVIQTAMRGYLARKHFSTLRTQDRLRREREIKKATLLQAQVTVR